MRSGIVALLFLALVAGANLRADGPQTGSQPAGDVDQKHMQGLIGKLGSPKYAERLKAARELEAVGPAALELLRPLVKSSDADISTLARRLVAALENKALAAEMLTPTRVHLVLKDATIADAVAQLAKMSGHKLEIVGNQSGIKNRKVTLDTGDVTFWEAFRQLCDKAALTEKISEPVQAPNGVDIGKLAMMGNKGDQPGTWNPTKAPVAAAVIQLVDGKPPIGPAFLAGALRVQLLPAKAGAGTPAGAQQFLLDVSAEPHVKKFGVVASVILDKAVDDQGQVLSSVLPPPSAAKPPLGHGGNGNIIIINGGAGNINIKGGGVVIVNGKVITPDALSGEQPVQRTVPIFVKPGAKTAKKLKELSGTLQVQALQDNAPVVTVDNILQAAGKTAAGAGDRSMHVESVEKLADGSIKIRVTVDSPAPPIPLGLNNNIIINGVPLNAAMNPHSTPSFPKLQDAQGKMYAPATVADAHAKTLGGKITHHATLTYRPEGKAAKLVLHEQRLVTFSVPFVLKDVPLQ